MSDHHESPIDEAYPSGSIHRLIKPLQRFLHVEAAGGVVLLICAIAALIAANSPFSSEYLAFWNTPVGFAVGDFQIAHSLRHWINDGLMVIFFFVIGLEVKREIALGELRTFRRAVLPVAAALGGMTIPAAIYLALQFGEPGQRGWGIPMATDIAFVVGCMAVLGRRVPASLRVLLLSIAIADDIGAILVIAVGYTETLHLSWLVLGLFGIAAVVFMQRTGIRSLGMYTLAGILVWVGFHESGVHATIAGVALGLMTPASAYLERTAGGDLLRRAGDVLHGGTWEDKPHRAQEIRRVRRLTRETISPLEYLIYALHPWVAFFIMPVFALANAGVTVEMANIISPVSLAVILGLVIGKPAGILLLSWLTVKSGLSPMPEGVSWRHMIGGGFLAGIGFTMALFIAGLAFDDDQTLQPAKVGVLAGSVLSALIGMAILAMAPLRGKVRAPESLAA